MARLFGREVSIYNFSAIQPPIGRRGEEVRDGGWEERGNTTKKFAPIHNPVYATEAER
jgi:hypothetical protein